MTYRIAIPNRVGYWVELHGIYSDSDMEDVNEWVTKHKLGKRMSYNMWKLKNEMARNLFILRWS